VSDLHAFWIQLFDERDHFFQMVEVLPVHDEIHGESDFVLANDARQFNLVRVDFGSGDPVCGVLAGILEAELNVIQTGGDQSLHSRLRQADAGGDQIGIESGGTRAGDKFSQIWPCQRFAAREVRVQHSELARLRENALPLPRGKFGVRAGHLQWVGAIDAVQRAAVRDFGDEG